MQILPNGLRLRRDTSFIMLIGWKPTGSDQTLRQDDVSVSFIMSKKEEANWKKKKDNSFFGCWDRNRTATPRTDVQAPSVQDVLKI